MAKQYQINITNGTGTENVFNDTYSVTANVNGYNNDSISPDEVTVVDGTNEYAFTISATGTLTLHVTDDGTESGNPIIGATFYRTDSTGTTYGSAFTTDSNGDATITNVPFATTTPPTIYYKQTTSDETHTFDATIKSTTLTESTKTIQISNPLPPSRAFTLKDANYEGLNIETGTINLN